MFYLEYILALGDYHLSRFKNNTPSIAHELFKHIERCAKVMYLDNPQCAVVYSTYTVGEFLILISSLNKIEAFPVLGQTDTVVRGGRVEVKLNSYDVIITTTTVRREIT